MERLSLNKENNCVAYNCIPVDDKWARQAADVLGSLSAKALELEDRIAQLEDNIKRLDRRMLGPGHESLSDM